MDHRLEHFQRRRVVRRVGAAGLQRREDRVEVGAVGQGEKLRAGRLDHGAHQMAVVAAPVVHDDNVAVAQVGDVHSIKSGSQLRTPWSGCFPRMVSILCSLIVMNK